MSKSSSRVVGVRASRVVSLCVGILVTGVAVACGSESSENPSCEDDGTCTEAGVSSSSGGSSSGSTSSSGGSSSGGSSSGGTSGGSTSSSGGSSSGGSSSGGLLECPVGTADCDDVPADCETNTASDVANCGRCERVCGGSATCTAGLCSETTILDPNVSSNWCGSAFSATHAYMITCWGNSDLSEIRSVPLEPGADVLGTRIQHWTNLPVVALRGILIDGPDVYFGLEAAGPSNLWKFPLAADGPEDVTSAMVFESSVRFDYLQLVGEQYYWADNTYTVPGVVAPASLKRRGKAEAGSTTLVSGLGISGGLLVTPTSLYWMESRTQGATTTFYRAPIAGSTAAETELVAVATPGSYTARRGEYVYWTHKAPAPDGKVRRVAHGAAGLVIEDVATGLNLPEGLATDADYAYFKQLDALYRVPLAGGIAEQLSPPVPAHDAQATQVFHVDDHYVYMAAGPGFGTSTLVRVAK